MIEADLGRVISKKKCSSGATVYVSDLTNDMWAVIVLDADSIIIHSRSFAYSKETEKKVWDSCRHYYKIVKDCVSKRQLEMLDTLEDS